MEFKEWLALIAFLYVIFKDRVEPPLKKWWKKKQKRRPSTKSKRRK
ncbi:hypothetical protein [Brevibacillus sp. MER 51]|nr:hypothetical protein [Brevibacillus sp. MER 51]MCM3141276.1 hypothetical protein [Brevibacillus sp. MER 51]